MKQNIFWLFLFFIGIHTNTTAQCGAELTEADHAFMQGAQVKMRSFDTQITRGIRDFPVKVHIVRRKNTSGAMNRTSLLAALQQANEYYINANLRFVMLKGINYIDSDQHYDFNNKNELALCDKFDDPNAINLYFFGSVKKNGVDVCGYTYYPNEGSAQFGRNRIILRNDCVDGGSTLIHELGHFFSLYHTHGRGKEKELVTRSIGIRNCEKAGDALCDTPADPMIVNEVDRNCNYIGKRRDARGEAYTPNPRNIMAYAASNCRTQFSKGQFGRINYAALHFRNYLTLPKNAPTENLSNEVKKPIVNTPPTKTSPPKNTVNPKPQSTILSGEITLKTNGNPVDMELDGNLYRSSRAFYAGTNYQVHLLNNNEGFVYVIGSDLTQQNIQIFPQDHQTARLHRPNTQMTLPSGGTMFQMDETAGKDYICVLYSKRPIRTDLVMQELERIQGNFIQRLYQVLWHQLVPQNNILYSEENNRLVFVADTKADQYSIVPIILELEHQ